MERKEWLFYRKSGTGDRKVVLFHGFGQDHRMFDPLTSLLAETCTLYAFDLFYHGKSKRKDEKLAIEDWQRHFSAFLTKEAITQFSIVSFSLGGRFALATAVTFPTQVNKLILIAPDGLYLSFWYRFATSRAGNPLFRYLMIHPEKFEKLVWFFEKARLIAPAMIRFARKELADSARCLLAYRSWTWFRPLQLAPKDLAQVMNAHSISVLLILGKKDFIIPISGVLPKLKEVQGLKTHLLPLKHHHLAEGSKLLIASWLNEEIL